MHVTDRPGLEPTTIGSSVHYHCATPPRRDRVAAGVECRRPLCDSRFVVSARLAVGGDESEAAVAEVLVVNIVCDVLQVLHVRPDKPQTAHDYRRHRTHIYCYDYVDYIDGRVVAIP